jgi:uncharacterized protein
MSCNDTYRALGRRGCPRLLATVPVGRVVHTRRALPAVLHVNFFLDTSASSVKAAGTSASGRPVVRSAGADASRAAGLIRPLSDRAAFSPDPCSGLFA